MRTHRFEPAIGQRFTHHQEGRSKTIWVITAIPQPLTIADPVLLTFTEELTQRVFHRSTTHLAQEILEGRLVAEKREFASPGNQGALALTNLLAVMSRSQLSNYKMKVNYVLALDRANMGQSHKSPDFCRLVETAYSLRLASWQVKVQANKGSTIEAIESRAPAPTSVYRWFLRYRKAGNDLSVLAQSTLATRTRISRKPKEKEVLAAFLSSRLALVERTSIKTLTDEFNQLMAASDPLHTDELIERLYRDACETAGANKRARNGNKTSMSSKRRRSSSGMASSRAPQMNEHL